MRYLVPVGLITILLLSACAGGLGSGDYSREQARGVQEVQMGVVESVREVKLEGTKSGVGTMAGAAVGGVAGSEIGRGKGAVVGSILGAVAGDTAGDGGRGNPPEGRRDHRQTRRRSHDRHHPGGG